MIEEPKFIISDIMTKDLVIVKPETTVLEAAQVMMENGISSLIVNKNGKTLGIVTDRDFTRVVASEKDLRTLKMRDIMTTDLISLAPKLTLADASETIRKHNIRHLLVKSPNDDYIGMLSVRDILSTLLEELREQNIKLRSKVEELEKFYRVAIDRELIMVKLKKRIHVLEKELGVESDPKEYLI
jgi:CBS domain-containing protein